MVDLGVKVGKELYDIVISLSGTYCPFCCLSTWHHRSSSQWVQVVVSHTWVSCPLKPRGQQSRWYFHKATWQGQVFEVSGYAWTTGLGFFLTYWCVSSFSLLLCCVSVPCLFLLIYMCLFMSWGGHPLMGWGGGVDTCVSCSPISCLFLHHLPSNPLEFLLPCVFHLIDPPFVPCA